MTKKTRQKILDLSKEYGEIRIRCAGHDSLPIDIILDFQGKLKKRTEENLLKLIERIFKLGFIAPFFVWDNKGDFYDLDGHGRSEALCAIREAGVEIPGLFPVDYIEAESEEEAREMLLSISSQYGEFVKEELKEWLSGLDDGVSNSLRLLDREMRAVLQQQDEEVYTKKIEVPTYEPKNEKPDISTLVDTGKSDMLISEIANADISEEIKSFLIHAAHRHTVFNYRLIADYYAHSPAEIQDLMEKSALVIIDFDKAIREGFVKMSDELAEQYRKEEKGEK